MLVTIDGDTYLCTGTLLNDAQNSFTPYFLTANHCLEGTGDPALGRGIAAAAAGTINTYWFVQAATCGSLATPAYAQTAAPSSSKTAARVRGTLVFLTGAASGLVAHESGHIVFSAAFGAHPRVRPLEGSAIPFFKIVHDPVSRRKEFVISSAGLWMQHADSEWILTARPRLREEQAPFLKGMLAFDLATSTVYGVAAFARAGPSERDTRGMAVSLGKAGAPEPAIGLLVLAPAVLDGYRFVRPEAKWAAWASRSVKIASVILTMAAGK
jgi:hypothetical protein